MAKAKPVPPVKRKKMEKNDKSLLDTSREGSRYQLAKAPSIAVKSRPLQVSPKSKSDGKSPQAQKLPSSESLIAKSKFTAGSKKSGEILDTGPPKKFSLGLVSSKEAQRQHKPLVKSVSSQILRPKVCKTPLLPPTHKKKVDSSDGVNLASTSGHLGLLEDAKDNTTNVKESEKELVYDYIDSNHARYYVGISSR